MMNLQELATLRRYDLPVKIVLSTIARWAWCASGRNCSTTSATAKWIFPTILISAAWRNPWAFPRFAWKIAATFRRD